MKKPAKKILTKELANQLGLTSISRGFELFNNNSLVIKNCSKKTFIRALIIRNTKRFIINRTLKMNNADLIINAVILSIYILMFIFLISAAWYKPIQDAYYKTSFLFVIAICLLRVVGTSLFINFER